MMFQLWNFALYARAILPAFGSTGGSKKRLCTLRATRCTAPSPISPA
jgi:hypothetical protein